MRSPPPEESEALLSGKYDVVRVNYANPDMVGHTGDMGATVAACEECDACVKELLDLVEELGGMFLVTADHGNADDMVQRDKKGGPMKDKGTGALLPLTSHTLAPVPVAIGGPALPEGIKFRDDLRRRIWLTPPPRTSTSWVMRPPRKWNRASSRARKEDISTITSLPSNCSNQRLISNPMSIQNSS